jgi:hypothetical protein
VAATAFIVAKKLAAAKHLREIIDAQKRMESVRDSTVLGTTKRMRDGGF